MLEVSIQVSSGVTDHYFAVSRFCNFFNIIDLCDTNASYYVGSLSLNGIAENSGTGLSRICDEAAIYIYYAVTKVLSLLSHSVSTLFHFSKNC